VVWFSGLVCVVAAQVYCTVVVPGLNDTEEIPTFISVPGASEAGTGMSSESPLQAREVTPLTVAGVADPAEMDPLGLSLIVAFLTAPEVEVGA
jgi:hypothetical protein